MPPPTWKLRQRAAVEERTRRAVENDTDEVGTNLFGDLVTPSRIDRFGPRLLGPLP